MSHWIDPDDFGQCDFWDEDGCYCVCGSACACTPFHPSGGRVVNTGDALHQILADALHEQSESKDR